MRDLLSKRPLLSLIIVTAILLTTTIVYYNFNGFFGQDSYEYLRITRSLNIFYETGSTPTYTVYPIMYPIICSLVNIVIPNTMHAMQLVSVVSLLLSAILLFKILGLLFGKSEYDAIFVFLLFVTSPYILRFGMIAMSDMFCISMWLASLYFSLHYSTGRKLRHLLYAAFFAGIAVLTRYPAAVMLLLPVWICVKTIITTKKYYYLIPVLIVAAACTLPDLIIRQRFIFWNLGNQGPSFSYDFFASQFNINNLFKSEFHNIDGVQRYKVPNLIFGFFQYFHPAFIFCGIVFLLLLFKPANRHAYTIPLIITIMLYTLFIGCNPYQNNRYLMFALPAVLIIYYLPFRNLIAQYPLKKVSIYFIFCIVFIIQMLLFAFSFKTTNNMNKTEATIAKRIGQLADLPVYTMGIDGALLAYNPDIEIINLYNSTLNVDDLKPGYVLFNNESFEQQFEGLLPIKNYRLLNDNGTMKQIEVFADGWILYQLN